MTPALPSEGSAAARAGAVLAVAGLVGLALWGQSRRAAPARRRSAGGAAQPRLSRHRPQSPGAAGEASAARARAARRARQGSLLLAASVAIDSATEHFRGGFHHPSMYAAPAAAAGTLAASAAGPGARGLRSAALWGAVAIGVAGHVYHARNILRRPGGLSWTNLFYAAPIGAPGALALAGLSGLVALALERPRRVPQRAEGRALALGSAAGLIGTTAEVALLHFRGAFHNPAMYIPLTLPPAAALALAEAARAPTPGRLRLARTLLAATGAMGIAGVGFHAWGVQRNMGGWRNWSQNLQVAPPLPAPPGFTGVALTGLGAVDLLEGRA